MRTYVAKPSTIKRDWFVIDATDLTLGRVAIKVTGNKAHDKIYYHHTGFPGGIKAESFEKLIARKPEQVLEIAVRGMLPKGPLGRAMFRKLKVYAGESHNHAAQQPQELKL